MDVSSSFVNKRKARCSGLALNGLTWPMDEPAIAGVLLSAPDCVWHRVRRMD